ncbi:hypothetical protein K437DRAFT_255325 [Tilletiaria anomala UBC 951]|uniref:NADH-ubiquinone oxidoreductase B12 subunit n=1 Tax=Tilletiaria anomala (strain ATCC 24038 / CBS 436.72 / UBC 951) TaxID=1037660 RepID=A0A066WEL0_TILAU|nr:uncharacterized protein K437DRAFT_255325 [Tilletiaria anomala UBC 951]KDN49200.1 hypothetical protein K437DRAFT_255325 [Tilletiaria anomala UBC 951]
MSQLYRDPWARSEAWRKHPVFSNRFLFRSFLPGFGLGTAAFALYYAIDTITHPTNVEKIKEQSHKPMESKIE